MNAIKGGAIIVDADFKLWNADLLFHLQIHKAGDGRNLAAQPFGDGPQGIQIRPVNFERQLRPHARQHVIQPVRYRLADVHRNRQQGQTRADIGHDLGLGAGGWVQIHLDFRRMHAFGMLIQFGAARATANRAHLWHLKDQLFGNQPDPVGFRQGYAGVEQHGYRKGAFVERRQERAGQHGGGNSRDHHRHRRQRHQRFLPAKHHHQGCAVAAFQGAHQPAFAVVEPLHAGQQVIGHHRRQGDRHHQTDKDRDDIGLPQRRKQPPLDARQREQRHEHQHDDHGGINDARPHLLAGRHHHIEG